MRYINIGRKELLALHNDYSVSDLSFLYGPLNIAKNNPRATPDVAPKQTGAREIAQW